MLLEALIGIAILGMTISAVAFVMLHGQEQSERGGEVVRATFYTEQALDGVRAIRDTSFSSVTSGTHGVRLNASGVWTLTGAFVVNSGGYITSLVVSPLSSDTIRATATTRWRHGYNRSGSVMIATDLTDWRVQQSIGDWSKAILEGSFTDNSSPLFNDVATAGNYAFVTADATTGIYVFDISDLTNPTRVANGFSLGYSAYDVAIRGNVLYVLTNDNNAELKEYWVGSPSSFSAGDLITSYNLPGAGRGKSMAINGTYLHVGADESAAGSQDEYYIFDVTSTGSIALTDSLDDTSSFGDVTVLGDTAYLGGSDDVSELRVADVTTPASSSFLGGYNLTDVHDGLAIVAVGTGVILGRADGAAISELVKFTVAANPVPSSPGPWYQEMGGSVSALATDSIGCYVWAATSNGSKELQVISLPGNSLDILDSYNTNTGDGRGIFYDVERDRVYMLTNKGFLIFKPNSSTGTCT